MILIAQISDLHLVAEGTRCYELVDTNALARRAIAAINRLRTRPDALIVTGDIIDTARAADYVVAREILGQLEMPFYLLSGNHDLTNGLTAAFSDRQFAAGPIADRLCYAADVGSIRLIVLDSSVPRAPHGVLCDAQLSFLDRELSEAIVGRHQNVLRIVCGHCHRVVFGSFAGTTVAIAPAVTHQLELALDGDETFAFNLEPPAFLLHRWTEAEGMTSQVAMIERYPGPFPFVWN